jgi:hypothetical protein
MMLFASPARVLADIGGFLRHPWDRAADSPLSLPEKLADALMVTAVAFVAVMGLGFAAQATIQAAGYTLGFAPPAWQRATAQGQLLHLALQVPLTEATVFLAWLRRPTAPFAAVAQRLMHTLRWVGVVVVVLVVGNATQLPADALMAHAFVTVCVLFALAPFLFEARVHGDAEPDPLAERYLVAPVYAAMVHGGAAAFALLGLPGMTGAPWPLLLLACLPWVVAGWAYAWLRVRFGFAYAVGAYGLHNALLWALG